MLEMRYHRVPQPLAHLLAELVDPSFSNLVSKTPETP